MRKSFPATLALLLALTTALAPASAPAQTSRANATPELQAARPTRFASQAPMLGATMAGKRIVAVGDYGVVLLSDDQGKSFRQASAVPVASTLTAVTFVDEQNGWAVGHWGVILRTSDGGEHWQLQRSDTQEDRPLFSVHFFDQQDGVAVGLWSLLLQTRDGGKTWNAVDLPQPPEGGRADRNLFKVFASHKGSLFVAAERGLILRSDDRGQHWQYLATGYRGSFWAGIALKSDTLLVAGLRGTVYRSVDDGRSWQAVESGTRSSLTDIVESGGKILAVGLDGVRIESSDQGASFRWTQRADRLSLTAAAALDSASGAFVSFSKKGVVADIPSAK